MSQIIDRVGTVRNVSTWAVSESGMRIMSDSWIDWKPRMLEPSKPMPGDQRVLVHLVGRDRRVLPHPGHVDELQVDHLDVVFLDHVHDFARFLGQCGLPSKQASKENERAEHGPPRGLPQALSRLEGLRFAKWLTYPGAPLAN